MGLGQRSMTTGPVVRGFNLPRAAEEYFENIPWKLPPQGHDYLGLAGCPFVPAKRIKLNKCRHN